MVLRCGLVSLWKGLENHEEDSWKLEMKFRGSGTTMLCQYKRVEVAYMVVC